MPDIQLTGTMHHGRPVMFLDDLATMFEALSGRIRLSEELGNPAPASDLLTEIAQQFAKAHRETCKYEHTAAQIPGRYHSTVFDRFVPPV